MRMRRLREASLPPPLAALALRSALGAALAIPAALAAPAASAAPLLTAVETFELTVPADRLPPGVTAGRGKLTMDSRRVCDAYVVATEFETTYDSQRGGSLTVAVRNRFVESGNRLLFQWETRAGGRVMAATSGSAFRTPEGVLVELAVPRRQTVMVPGDIVFPGALLERSLAAAEAGERRLSLTLFNGGGDGLTASDVTVAIGVAPAEVLDPAGQAIVDRLGLAGLTRWHIRTETVLRGLPDTLTVVEGPTYANGVQLNGTVEHAGTVMPMRQIGLEPTPATPCQD